MEHGPVIKAFHRTIDYQAIKIVTWFVEQLTEARRTEQEQSALAEVFTLLGNSGYGMLIEALEPQTCVAYTNMIRLWTQRCEARSSAICKSSGKHMSWKAGSRVYNHLAYLVEKLLLESYYDFVDRYFDRHDFELIQMDTDSNYIAISANRLE